MVVTIDRANTRVPAQITLPEQTPRVGGEGAVYFAGAFAVKVYHEWDAAAVARLLLLQRLGRHARPGQPLTWPIAIAVAVDGHPALGAVFYRLPERFEPLYRLVYSRDWADKFFGRGATWGGHLLRLAWGVANAVHRLHSSGAVHTDLHFKNILVDGGAGEVALVDLDGVAVYGHPAGPARGLPPFIAPEQELGDHRPVRAKDLYALAVNLLWTLLLRSPVGEGALRASGPADYGGALSVRALTPALQVLAHKALIEGRLDPAARPLASDWSAALADAGDAVVDCPRCLQRVIYPFWLCPAARRSCPFCGGRWQAQAPVVLAIGHIHPGGSERAVRHIVLAPGVDLRASAFGPGRHPPFGRATDPAIGRLCRSSGPVLCLTNIGPEPWRAWTGDGHRFVAPESVVELRPGVRLRPARGGVSLLVVE